MQFAAMAERVGRRRLKAPESFKFYRYEFIEPDMTRLTGCVVDKLYTKGPRKGRPVYDGKISVVVVSDAELDAEAVRYSEETGHCAECLGEGKMCVSAHVNGQRTYRPCRTCQGTGKYAALASLTHPEGE
jgi:hypothetical protein